MSELIPVTGVQAASVALDALLRAWASQFPPKDYAALLDLFARRLAHEIAEHGSGRPV